MSNDMPTPPEDGFPQGQVPHVPDIPFTPKTEAKSASTPTGPWQPPTAQELAAILPQYEIESMLGRGGMGAVYKGRQISLDRPVAIKILSNALEDSDASFAERFKNEAKAMAKLSHPGIVGVYDFGETAGGLLYIVMEFIEGTDVAKMIAEQKRLHSEHAMAITAHVCDALSYAHERGIIHRDIKPANIMVGYDGVVKVADFGLAKMSNAIAQSGLTMSGMVMGTPHYLAPEAFELGSAVDQRADIFAVGVMLYQMLTGKFPKGLFELPSLQVPGLDPRYDVIISKALREDREMRYPRVLDMRHDLDAILTQPIVKVEATSEATPAALETKARPQRPGGQPSRHPQPRVIVRREKQGAPMLWAGLVVLGGVAGWLFFQNSKHHDPKLPQRTPAPGAVPSIVENATLPSDITSSTAKSLTQDSPAPAMQGETAQTTIQSKDQHQASEPPNTTKRIVDLIPLVDVKRNSIGRQWQFIDGTLILPPGGGDKNRIELPYEVQAEEYDIEVEFSSTTNTPLGFSLAFPAAGKHLFWYLNLFKKTAGPLFHGFPGLDGKASNEPGEARVNGPSLLQPGKRHVSMVRVRKSSLTGMLDQKTIVYWEGDLNRFKESAWARPKGMSYPDVTGDNEAGTIIYRASITEYLPQEETDPTSPPHPSMSAVPVTWTDTKGRSITATFKGLVGDNVMLEIAGRVTPVPLNTLSAESQKMARNAPQLVQPAVVGATANATKDTPFTNSLGMKFVPVPGTNVLFCIHETRNQDYAAYAGSNPTVNNKWYSANQDAGLPVAFVNWQEAKAFCDWVTQKDNIKHRLPTDREWSFATGIGSLEDAQSSPEALNKLNQDIYPWGKTWPPPNNSGNYWDEKINELSAQAGVQTAYTDGFIHRSPAMSFRPNTLGIYDLEGNVLEWCEDWYDLGMHRKVLRGPSFLTGMLGFKDFCLSHRRNTPPEDREDRFPEFGFRCVIDLSQP